MIPVCKRENQLLIVLSLVRRLRIVNDQRSPKAIWILASIVRMVPISSRLVDLKLMSATNKTMHKEIQATLNS